MKRSCMIPSFLIMLFSIGSITYALNTQQSFDIRKVAQEILGHAASDSRENEENTVAESPTAVDSNEDSQSSNKSIVEKGTDYIKQNPLILLVVGMIGLTVSLVVIIIVAKK